MNKELNCLFFGLVIFTMLCAITCCSTRPDLDIYVTTHSTRDERKCDYIETREDGKWCVVEPMEHE